MPIDDIREYKSELRKKIRRQREEMPPKQKALLDKLVLKNILKLRQYKANDTILTYVSTKIEVDTFGLIRQALKDGKRVAVPRCIDNSREMDFYYITSLNQLEPRTFGVLEPIKEQVCYSSCVQWKLVHGFYDRRADLLVTEKYIRQTNQRTTEV